MNSLSAISARSLTYIAVFCAMIVHGGLLPFTVGQTYDAYIHMFFGDHYYRSWFDPWEPRWYTGFTVNAYPPGSHQMIGLLLPLMSHQAAFICVQMISIVTLIVGIYRFNKLWVPSRAAAFGAIYFVFSTSLAETVHIFGQLPTTLSIGLFLNATPHIQKWIRRGQIAELAASLIFMASATAAHHVTPIFATLLFVGPLGICAWAQSLPDDFRSKPLAERLKLAAPAPFRGIILGIGTLAVVVGVVLPYWLWSLSDPITQVSIPHGSRESFFARPDLGFMFFVIPWGAGLLILPFAFLKSLRSGLWPLGLSLFVCFILGTGGTTPVPKILLGPAFEILTLDRFTFWGSLLILPFAGLVVESVLSGKTHDILIQTLGSTVSRLLTAAMAAGYAMLAIATMGLPLLRPTQPKFIDPAPITQFMSEDYHNSWRYMTLGFGDQFAYHSALIDAESVDGNYHSARRLSDLTRFAVERLENSKYLGLPGLQSLNQFLTNAEAYHLKFIFSVDEFYDPALYYNGWRPVIRLRNGVMVWDKSGVSPLPSKRPRKTFPRYQVLHWGIVPPFALLTAFALLGIMGASGRLVTEGGPRQSRPEPILLSKRHRSTIRAGLACTAAAALIFGIALAWLASRPLSAEETVSRYFKDLDFRRFEKAYARLDRSSRMPLEQYLKTMRSRGGLTSSYAKLTGIRMTTQQDGIEQVSVDAELTYLSSVGTKTVRENLTLLRDGKKWAISPDIPSKVFVDVPVIRGANHSFVDLFSRRSADQGESKRNLERPAVIFGSQRLVIHQSRLYVIGQVTNATTDPACLSIAARTSGGNAGSEQLQFMGEVGAHQLRPGETASFKVAFLGVVANEASKEKIRFDNDLYDLPLITEIPTRIRLEAAGSVCAIEAAPTISIADVGMAKRINRSELNLRLTNESSLTAGVVQLRVNYHAADGGLLWTDPAYLETNLVPGEQKVEHIPLIDTRTISFWDVPIETLRDGTTLPAEKIHTPLISVDGMGLDPRVAGISLQILPMPFDGLK